MMELLGMSPSASAHGPEIDCLLALLHWLMFVLFLGWSAYFVYVLNRFRSSRHPKADYAGAKGHFSKYAEIAVAVVEVVLLVVFSIPFWSKSVVALPPEKDALVVNVVAQQFAWNFHYAGNDGVFGKKDIKQVDATNNPLGLDSKDPHASDDVTTINNLYLPVNKPVILKISSQDVIHSFGSPHMRVKQDAIPGMMIPATFKPILTTAEMRKKLANEGFNYEVACSQLCGDGHSKMRAVMHVLTQEEFDKKLAELSAAKSEAGEEW